MLGDFLETRRHSESAYLYKVSTQYIVQHLRNKSHQKQEKHYKLPCQFLGNQSIILRDISIKVENLSFSMIIRPL